eukprot:Hpha_TRINITY_DN13600_c0_g1::TRINITY_DN13600_c0_g1_i4::g.122494::m.122494
MADLIVDELTEVLAEPYVYLSTSQVDRVTRYPVLAPLAPRLPGWVPQRLIAQALGHSSAGMRNAVAEVGRPYVWATEFENVHGVWAYREPRLNIDGEEYDCSETYFHRQKPKPFNAKEWGARRVDVMRRGVRAKFRGDPALRALLLATGSHPLVAVKSDRFWGFDPNVGGENMLAKLWVEIREEIMEEPRPRRVS